MPRYQVGSLRKIMRAEGLTWVLRYYATRSDGKRVERNAVGLVKDIGSSPADASREVDRQKLRETINQLQPFEGKPRTFGQLCQDYIENELRIDQTESARPKAFPTVETYERHLINRIIPRWGKLAPLAVESRDVEAWFRQLRKGNAQKKVRPLADPTIDKIRRIMSLVFKHGQRCNFLPRQQEGNPMNWVSQRTTSDYRAIVMTPKQAFEVLLNILEPRRTLTLSDAATALRVSELLGLMWMDLDFEGLVIYVRRAYVWGRFKEPKSKAPKAPVPMHPLLAGFLLAWHERTKYAKESDYVFPSVKLRGKKPLSASVMVQKYLRPAAVSAGVIPLNWKGRFGFHNFRHSLATALVKLKVDPKTVQGVLRHEDFGTTMELYAQSNMESMRDAQGKFLDQLMGDRIHLLTERVQ
ncbi:MAG TPA: tyrosine-type recombinase/integrase [Terriglobales bacterium]|nr:tyrosine-type recombinase/integrase [Terriglobales bacterium]